MSLEALKWVKVDAPDVPTNCLAVLYALADHANPDGGDAFPSVERLAHDARKSERAVQRDLAELEERGLIRKGDQRAAYYIEPRYRPTVWQLALERVRPAFVPKRQRLLEEAGRAAVGDHPPYTDDDMPRGDFSTTPDDPGVTATTGRGDLYDAAGVVETSPEPPTEPPAQPTDSASEVSHVGNARASAPRPPTRLQPHGSSPTAELDPLPPPDPDQPPAELGGRGYREFRELRERLKRPPREPAPPLPEEELRHLTG